MSELSTYQQSSNLNSIKMKECYANKMQYPPEQYQLVQQDIIEIIQTGLDSQTILSRLAAKIGQIMRADTCIIVAGTNFVRPVNTGFWHSSDTTVLAADRISELLSHPVLTEDLVNRREPLAIPDIQATKNEYAVNLPWQLRGFLKIGTYFQGSANGIISIGQSQPRDWTLRDQKLIKVVSDSVAIALSVIQLQQQNEKSTRYQALIKDISEAIRQHIDIDSVLAKTVEETAQFLEVDKAAVLMLKYKSPQIAGKSNHQTSEIEAQIISQWSAKKDVAQLSKPYLFSLGDSLWCTQAFKNAPHPLILETKTNFPDLSSLQKSDREESQQNRSALLIMPLMGSITSDLQSGVVIGFLVLENLQTRLWETEELELIKWVSGQMSTAILHDRALNKVQSIVSKRTAQLKWSLEVQAKLSEGMRQQILQLRQLNKLKDEFVESISHELKTPLTKMKMAIEMLRQPGRSPERKARYLDILEDAYNREEKLIGDLLIVQKLESNRYSLNPEQLDLKEIVSELASSFREQWSSDNKRLNLAVDYTLGANSKTSLGSSLMLYTDPNSIKQILSELLTNASKYSDRDTTVHLDITQKTTLEGDRVIFTITNYGLSISPEEQTYIFDKFRRGEGIPEKAIPGIGIGLTLVKYLVEHLNGTINVSSYPSENPSTFINSFTVTVPQFQPEHK
ncbi:MAG: GAF domain-containing sensor histidine kinase [Prochloraceae cyanobacterium]|nr:GAF domain-containing sensor histidine kinase [Prochloraceae cyanobacterium]